MSKSKDRIRTLQIYVAPDIRIGVSCDVYPMTWAAGEAICSCMHDEGTNASHCGVNQNTVLHDAVPLDETARPEMLMEAGIYLSR